MARPPGQSVGEPRRDRPQRCGDWLGHRNLLGLAFAPDGRLWETEMGPMGGDELNLIVRRQELRLAAGLERQQL